MPETKSLLIIEDDPDLRTTLGVFLNKIGYEVLTAKNCEEGLKMCVKNHPRAVLMDIMMPGMDGYEACSRIKGDPATSETVVILITAKKAPEVNDKGPKSGADYWIAKPVEPNDVGADLYILFDRDFRLNEEETSRLRVTHALSQPPPAAPPPEDFPEPAEVAPSGSEGLDPSALPTVANIRSQKQSAMAPVQRSAPFAPTEEASPELKQVHSLLLALKDSLRDTSTRPCCLKRKSIRRVLRCLI